MNRWCSATAIDPSRPCNTTSDRQAVANCAPHEHHLLRYNRPLRSSETEDEMQRVVDDTTGWTCLTNSISGYRLRIPVNVRGRQGCCYLAHASDKPEWPCALLPCKAISVVCTALPCTFRLRAHCTMHMHVTCSLAIDVLKNFSTVRKERHAYGAVRW
jgi:hypothetical protein